MSTAKLLPRPTDDVPGYVAQADVGREVLVEPASKGEERRVRVERSVEIGRGCERCLPAAAAAGLGSAPFTKKQPMCTGVKGRDELEPEQLFEHEQVLASKTSLVELAKELTQPLAKRHLGRRSKRPAFLGRQGLVRPLLK